MSPLPRHRFHAIVPAAGQGMRMGQAIPKQYLPLLGRPIIEHTLTTLLAVTGLDTVVLVVAADDLRWRQLCVADHPRLRVVVGGTERSDSVLSGVRHLATYAGADDWALVHDVARPCIRATAIQAMMAHFASHAVGGILAIPVSDTIKSVADRSIYGTVDRSALWQAQTPQMFRLGLLLQALESAQQNGTAVTDEASALELSGYQPEVMEGSPSNIKITRPEDLALAEFFLRQHTLDVIAGEMSP